MIRAFWSVIENMNFIKQKLYKKFEFFLTVLLRISSLHINVVALVLNAKKCVNLGNRKKTRPHPKLRTLFRTCLISVVKTWSGKQERVGSLSFDSLPGKIACEIVLEVAHS